VLAWFYETEIRATKADSELLANSTRTELLEFGVDLQADETAVLEEAGPKHANTYDSEWAKAETQRLLASKGISLDPTSEDYSKVHRLIAQGLIESIRRRQSRLRGQVPPATYDPLFAEIFADGLRLRPMSLDFAKILRNATAAKEAETKLREALDRFETLANNMSRLAWMADATARDSGSISVGDYTGTTLDQVRGWGFKAVHHSGHVERVME
jgi:PAS domain-containing protein